MRLVWDVWLAIIHILLAHKPYLEGLEDHATIALAVEFKSTHDCLHQNGP